MRASPPIGHARAPAHAAPDNPAPCPPPLPHTPPAPASPTNLTPPPALASDFAREHLTPHAARWDERSEFPIHTFKRAAELGFGGLYTPEEFGGAALSRSGAVRRGSWVPVVEGVAKHAGGEGCSLR
jgi:hypothetical protein